MKEIAKLIAVLAIICGVSGSLMALVHDMTKERIAMANEAAKINAMQSVLPEFDNNPLMDTKTISSDGNEWLFYIARKDGQFAGTAFVTTSSEGYGGNINIMVGVNAKGELKAIEILSPHQETPGLGAKITGDKFKKNFIDKDIRTTKWKVAKDGGDIDQITAATISSRAVANAIKQGLDVYIANESEIAR